MTEQGAAALFPGLLKALKEGCSVQQQLSANHSCNYLFVRTALKVATVRDNLCAAYAVLCGCGAGKPQRQHLYNFTFAELGR